MPDIAGERSSIFKRSAAVKAPIHRSSRLQEPFEAVGMPCIDGGAGSRPFTPSGRLGACPA